MANAAPIRIPGRSPAMNRLPMEVSAIEPYTTKVMEGGIITPIAPEAAINAAEKEGEYPDLIMAGTRITPSAATVAGPDPEIAAKKQDTMTHTMAIPPFQVSYAGLCQPNQLF